MRGSKAKQLRRLAFISQKADESNETKYELLKGTYRKYILVRTFIGEIIQRSATAEKDLGIGEEVISRFTTSTLKMAPCERLVSKRLKHLYTCAARGLVNNRPVSTAFGI